MSVNNNNISSVLVAHDSDQKFPIYEGEYVDGKYHGYGVLNYGNGCVYKGEFQNGNQYGQGTVTYGNSSVMNIEYTGNFAANQYQGFGIRKERLGRTYTGNWDYGQKNGHGTETFTELTDIYISKYYAKNYYEIYKAAGLTDSMCLDEYDVAAAAIPNIKTGKYVGNWKDGCREGEGIEYSIDGSKIEGNWHYGERDGFAKITTPDGTITYTEWYVDELRFNFTQDYVGETLNGVPHGYGEVHSANGSSYKGYFEHGKKHGQGIFKYISYKSMEEKSTNEFCTYIGNFVNNKFDGYGVAMYCDGTKYDGHWKSGLHHGHGIDYRHFGYVYDGNWEDGQKHGQGIQYHNEYSVIYHDLCYNQRNSTKEDHQRMYAAYETAVATHDKSIPMKEEKFVGTFYKNGKLTGIYHRMDNTTFEINCETAICVYTMADGTTITTSGFKNDLCHGDGTEVQPDGTKYIGTWRKGKRRWLFTIIAPDGTVSTQDFR